MEEKKSSKDRIGWFGIKGKEFGPNLVKILTDLTGISEAGGCGGISTSVILNEGALCMWTRVLAVEVKAW